MSDRIIYLSEKYPNEFYSFLKHVGSSDKKILITGDLKSICREIHTEKYTNNELQQFIEKIKETISLDHSIFMDVREKIASALFYKINYEEYYIQKIEPGEYLSIKATAIKPEVSNNILTLNFKPFYDKSPAVRDTKYIGAGFEYLNRYLSSKMFTDIDKWKNILFEFLRKHHIKDEQLLLNERIKDTVQLNSKIDEAVKLLKQLPPAVPFEEFRHKLQNLGFEKGLGKDAVSVIKNLNLLDQLINSPDYNALVKFITSISMITRIAIISPHGYFAQEGVLGLPDTGGQIVYILDQVKALEKSMLESLKAAGLEVLPKIVILTRLIPEAGGTTCNQRLEKIYGTKNSWILRVPFKEHNKSVTDRWISRFEVWPYLEEFAEDSYTALTAEFEGKPDLIIGNYSDGNLVSYLLAKKFRVTQCCIAHALEKSKYLFSALYWHELEMSYHFSMQFTADLIAINSADFLLTSTYQEIAGTEDSIGQYESYKHFTMPGLYRVLNGVNPFNINFNIVSPGVNEKIFFPYTKYEKRMKDNIESLNKLLFENVCDNDTVGELEDPGKIPIFTMARLDRIKNITFLVKCFGESPELQNDTNLIIIAGKIDESHTRDSEEKEQIKQMHDLINKYKLTDKIRWIGKLLPKDESGEVYRVVADRKGIFVQPGLFEGFGLTVLEAMISGLPVFATKYGGPLEIINNGINGFHIDTVNEIETTEMLVKFVGKMKTDKNIWNSISQNAIKRVTESYTWKIYADRLISLAKLYGFWKFSSELDKGDMEAYLDLIFHTLFKPRAKTLLDEHVKR
ncbi:MAG: sucrose synthase [bacterium]